MLLKLFTFLRKLFGKAHNPAPGKAHLKTSDPPLATVQSAEELCGVHDGMTSEQLRSHLKLLYQRHNRAASSLDEVKRERAKIMLDAIVEVREKHVNNNLAKKP